MYRFSAVNCLYISIVPQMVHVGSSQVGVVNEFTYLGACTTCDGSSESKILRRIGIARNCMTLLEKHVWKPHIRVDTKVRLYQTYAVPVLVYGSKAWLSQRLLLGDLLMPFTRSHSKKKSFGSHIANTLPMLLGVRETTSCPPVSTITKKRWLRFFGHVACSDSRQAISRCSDHQEIEGDLEGGQIAPDWGGLMLMYSRPTSVSTQLEERPTIIFSGNVSSTRNKHSIGGLPLMKKIFRLHWKNRHLFCHFCHKNIGSINWQWK